MREIVEKIAWRRRGSDRDYVGSLVASSDLIRLAGRDARSCGDMPIHAQVLARKLAGLTRPAALLTQGGAR
jgi:hypothetical protein